MTCIMQASALSQIRSSSLPSTFLERSTSRRAPGQVTAAVTPLGRAAAARGREAFGARQARTLSLPQSASAIGRRSSSVLVDVDYVLRNPSATLRASESDDVTSSLISIPARSSAVAAAALAALSASELTTGEALAAGAQQDYVAVQLNPAFGEVSAVLEASVLLLYLGGLLALLAFGTFLVVRQVLVRRELENAAKELQERVRTGQASSEEYYELGAVMLRKKFYTLANKYLIQAVQKWEGDEQELAQVHNALGFSYFSEEKWDQAVAEYEKAVKLQPAYVTAWNNMGDALEKKKDFEKALKAYDSSLMYDPTNRIATERRNDLQRKVQVTY